MTADQPLAGKKVAVLVETEYIADEIEGYLTRFAALGAEVHLMAHLWGKERLHLVCDIDSPDRPVSSLHTLWVDREVADARAEDYAIIIQSANYTAVRLREIPPMHSLGSPEEVTKPPAVRFFAEAMRNTRIVKGAMCHGLWILTPHPELMKGRKVICHTVVLADIINAGATFVPDKSEVVVDDDLVTARSFANFDAYFDTLVRVALAKA
jgi:protease I